MTKFNYGTLKDFCEKNCDGGYFTNFRNLYDEIAGAECVESANELMLSLFSAKCANDFNFGVAKFYVIDCDVFIFCNDSYAEERYRVLRQNYYGDDVTEILDGDVMQLMKEITEKFN